LGWCPAAERERPGLVLLLAAAKDGTSEMTSTQA
jgi:hypothetical protein